MEKIDFVYIDFGTLALARHSQATSKKSEKNEFENELSAFQYIS